MYYSSFNPNINLTKPLKNFGTFFTTIFIFNHTPPYFLQNSHATPNINNAQPIINSHPVIGSNNTSNIPEPTPIRQTPIVFFNASNIYYLLFYIILFVLHKRASIYLF